MSDSNFPELGDDLSPQELAKLNAQLSAPEVWAQPSSHVGDAVLAAIQAEKTNQNPADAGPSSQRTPPQPTPSTSDSPHLTSVPEPQHHASAPVEPNRPSPANERIKRWWTHAASATLGAAAAILLLIGGLISFQQVQQPNIDVELAATPEGDNATGVAQLDETPNGVRILLTVKNLPPAPEGSYYQAWLVRSDPQTRIGAGTFHLRGGGGTEIELWSGVSPEEFSTMTVTLQQQSDPTGPGMKVLQGSV